jgi:plasmid stability protein
MVRKPTELRPVMTRLPERLRSRLEREAARNDRSMNAEIIHRLEQSFVPQEQEKLVIATVKSTLGEITGIGFEELVKMVPKGAKS